VVSKKAKQSVVTTEKGNFEITCKKRDKIEVKAAGFETATRTVGSGSDLIEINMVVKEGGESQKAIVEGGFLKEADLKNGMENLIGENYDYANYFDIYDLIEDRYEDVLVDRSSSVPKVNFRQSSDIPASASLQAVFEVDGNLRGDLSIYKPTDIASVKLLKGSQAFKKAGKEVAGVFIIKMK
jgi:hypothetical protein